MTHWVHVEVWAEACLATLPLAMFGQVSEGVKENRYRI